MTATPPKPSVAQQAVRLRLERGSARPEPRVDRVTDHHARNAGPDRGAERREVLRAEDAVDPRLVGRDRRRAEPGKVLRAGGAAEPAREGDAVLRTREVARAERPVGEVEHRREGRMDSRPPQRRRRLPPRAERLGGRSGTATAARQGASAGKVFTVPPSWSAKTSEPRGRGELRVPLADEHAAEARGRRASRRRRPPPPSRAASSPRPRLRASRRGGASELDDRREHAATVPLRTWP